MDDKLINVSIAVVQVPQQTSEHDEMIGLLEYAVKESKKNGKGKLIYCDETMQHVVDRRNKVIRAVKNAMEYNGFEVYYQPIHRIKGGRRKRFYGFTTMSLELFRRASLFPLRKKSA